MMSGSAAENRRPTALRTDHDRRPGLASPPSSSDQSEWPNLEARHGFQLPAMCPGNSIRDNECLRTWVRTGGEFKRLVELPRVFGPRPAVQLYSVEGAPLGKDIPFVPNFAATPDLVIEPWMAMVSRDGKRLVATVSKPGLFLFQNREFSCIHCGTGFWRNEAGPDRHRDQQDLFC